MHHHRKSGALQQRNPFVNRGEDDPNPLTTRRWTVIPGKFGHESIPSI